MRRTFRLATRQHELLRPVLITEIPTALDRDNRVVLLCPQCGSSKVHPVSVFCLPAGDGGGAILIEKRGVLWGPDYQPLGTGVAISLQLQCDSQHTFRYSFSLQDGQTLVKRSVDPESAYTPPIWTK